MFKTIANKFKNMMLGIVLFVGVAVSSIPR
jgi:hypothetical protein